MNEGRLLEAEQEWRQGIQEDAKALGCYEHLGDLYLTQKRFPEAAAAYTAAVHLAPTDGTLFLRLNRADLAIGDMPGAEAAAKRAAELRPNDPDALGLYGLLEVKLKNDGEALTALRRAHSLRPNDSDYLLELVRLDIEKVAFVQAQSELMPYLQTHPTDYWACHLMGVIYEMKSYAPADLKTALSYEQRAQAGLPDDPRIYITLGDLYLDLGRPVDARKAFQTGRRILPNSEAMLQGLVKSYNRLHDPKDAAVTATALQVVAARHQRIPYLDQQMVLKPNDVVSGLELARLEEADGDVGGAQVLLTSLLRHSPREVRLHRALSDFYRRHGQPDMAARTLRSDYIP